MRYLNTLERTSLSDRWLIVKHSQDFVTPDPTLLILKLYTLRLVATLVTGVIWVIFTLSTGIFTAGMVVLFGGAIGCSHFLLGQKPNQFHLLNALFMTIAGGLISSFLAGLAFFSAKMGVGYWQVLITNLTPENMQFFSGVFLQGILPEDFIYYMVATMAVIFFTQHYYFYGFTPSKRIEVRLINGRVCHLRPSALNTLLSMNRIVEFKRSDGWAIVGRTPLRKENNPLPYSGSERRNTS